MVGDSCPKILLFQDYFSPGFLAGGMQTASFHLLSMPHNFNIRVVTSNFDLNEKLAYPHLIPDKWSYLRFGNRFFPIWYGSKGKITLKNYIHFFAFKPDWIYLQGIFGFRFFLIPLLLGKFLGIPIIICPHGMLDKGSLKQKFFKKWIYLKLFRIGRLHKKIRWQATSKHEVNQINNIFGKKASIFKINLAPPIIEKGKALATKKVGSLHLFYFSRITPKKNLHLILISLLASNKNIFLTIIGPLDDKAYWQNKCVPLVKLLENRVFYKGCISKLDHYLILKEGHFMILPSEGENFCYALFECLANGIPVIISRCTPWDNIEKYKGGIILDDFSKMTHALNELVLINELCYRQYSDGALKCANEYFENGDFLKNYKNLFFAT